MDEKLAFLLSWFQNVTETHADLIFPEDVMHSKCLQLNNEEEHKKCLQLTFLFCLNYIKKNLAALPGGKKKKIATTLIQPHLQIAVIGDEI